MSLLAFYTKMSYYKINPHNLPWVQNYHEERGLGLIMLYKGSHKPQHYKKVEADTKFTIWSRNRYNERDKIFSSSWQNLRWEKGWMHMITPPPWWFYLIYKFGSCQLQAYCLKSHQTAKIEQCKLEGSGGPIPCACWVNFVNSNGICIIWALKATW